MSESAIILVENVYKKFCSNLRRGIAYGASDTFATLINWRRATPELRKAEFWALENVDLRIERGETFGLVGANGSGKTTLLRLISGIFPPTRGRVTVRGRVGGLIAVGAGFHPHMSGKENIFLNGAILGMSRQEIADKIERIIRFADIGDFLDAPVATYSSGMHVRLGFAIAIHSEADIVLIDEILAVGDSKFQRQCLDRIRTMREKGITFVMVSHNTQNIEGMCQRALLLDKGKPLMVGAPSEVIPAYELLLTSKEAGLDQRAPGNDDSESPVLRLVKKYSNFGTDEVMVHSVQLKNSSGVPSREFVSEESLALEICLDAKIDLPEVTLWQSFIYVSASGKEEDNLVSLGTRKQISLKKGVCRLRLSFFPVQLTTGRYKIAFHLFDSTFTNPYTQGHYGYFLVKKGIATQLRVGIGTPMMWADPTLQVESEGR